MPVDRVNLRTWSEEMHLLLERVPSIEARDQNAARATSESH